VVTVKAKVEPQPEGSFGKKYEDLIPLDATIEAYDPRRFSVVTGLVRDLDGLPIADVSVTIHDHPEYGTVSTDGECRFSIPVEGGGTITVVYQKEGLITAHRKVYVPWNDIAVAETIQMVEEDSAATTIAFDGNPDSVFTHQSTELSDEFGSRSCSMVFTGDNQAYEVDAQGNVIRELNEISTRATEFTTPESMPAVLPPTSGYTYCTELSVDGVRRVKFAKPVITWVDNFLGFDVGEVVPVGYYDRDKGVWVPSENGMVVRILDTDSDGVVDALDADGDDTPDDLDGDGSLSDEVLGLEDSVRYPTGSTFWRVGVEHFTPWDHNWPYGPPADAVSSNPESEPDVEQQRSEQRDCKGYTSSFVEERSRIFHEDIPIPGTEIRLHYSSHRVKSFPYKITVPASGRTVPESLKRIIVKVEVAGRDFEEVLDALPDQEAEFIWDGRDQLGRSVIGPSTALISVGFVYDAVYYQTPRDRQRAFAQIGGQVTGIRTRQEMIVWNRTSVVIHKTAVKGREGIAEGWTLSSHHKFNSRDPSTLHKGDGTIIKNINSDNKYRHVGVSGIVDTFAGNKLPPSWSEIDIGDGGLATEAQLFEPDDVAVDSSGNLYIADSMRVRKVDPNGIITTVAGNGMWGYSGDGGPATEAQLGGVSGVAVDFSGNLYMADSGRIRKVDLNGTITTVAGGGSSSDGLGDDGPATAAYLAARDLVVDSEGNMYIADSANNRIRKVDPSGIITTIAGSGIRGYRGDGGSATEARLRDPRDVVVDSAGNLYIADYGNNCIRKVEPSGIITTVAGTGIRGYSGDGGPAVLAKIGNPSKLAVDPVDNIYIADTWNYRIRKLDQRGTITTVVGDGGWGSGKEGVLATQTGVDATAVALDPTANFYVLEKWQSRVCKVGPSAPYVLLKSVDGYVFAEDHGLGHVMTDAGLHEKTVDLDTGTVLYTFAYDERNNLIGISDQFGNQLTIVRDLSGVPTSLTSPDGLTTTLSIDANNHLSRITYPDGSYYHFEYAPNALMTAKVEPEGNRFDHVFDSTERLTEVTDEEGGRWRYTRTRLENNDILTEVLTAEGNLTSYLDHTDPTGAYTSYITDSTGAQTVFTHSPDGLTMIKSLPCGLDRSIKYGLDSEYRFQYPKEIRESTPDGLTKVTLREKTYGDTDSDEIPDLISEAVTVNGRETTLETDILKAEKTMFSPEGRTVTTLYDRNFLLTRSLSIPGLYETIYEHDARGRLASINTKTRQTTFAYDAKGNLSSVTDPENHPTTYGYDAVGRITWIGRPDGSSVGFRYDRNGNMTVLTNPATIDHTFGYNKVNLNSSYTTPLSGSYSYVYDKDRRLIRVNFPSGKQIDNVYDNGRLEQIQTPEGGIDLTYLCGSKIGSISNGTEAVTYGYDGSLVTSENLSGTLEESLSYAYNNDFNLTSFTCAGDTVSYAYDNDGLLTGAGSFTIGRKAANGLPELVAGGALSLSRIFNGYGEVEGQNYTVGGQGLTSWDLIRDGAGRITGKTETVEGVTSNYVYTYDSVGRLLTVEKDGTLVEEYRYDSVGTRVYEMNVQRDITGRTFSYDDEDHLLTAGDAAYRYDLDGYLSSKTVGTELPYEVTSYAYSSRGELLKVTMPDSTRIEYLYDPLGRRIAKKANDVITEKYLWQGLTRLLAVYDGSDNLIMRFLYADSRMPVAMEKGGATYYLTFDQVGSLRLVADSSGNVVKRIDYDSFGNITNDTNASFEIPFGFAGGLHDRDTNLVRFGFRDYDPDVGRWTAKDPIFFQGGDIDLYGYCLNDPVNWVDPSGEFGIAGVVIGGLSGAYVGFLSGVQSGSILKGLAAGALGGFAGGVVGSFFPHLSAPVASMIGGFVGGAAGGAIGKALNDPCASGLDLVWAGAKGAGVGAFGGFIGGHVVGAAATLGAKGTAAYVTSGMITAPISFALGMNWQ
jgi:RHS repeat-associated protein